MQVFGLPGHVIRSAAVASRLAAKSLSNEAAIRADAVRRWQRARAAGLPADAAAAIGVSRATLYRWAKRPEPFSRRPRRMRRRQWSPALAQAVEELRGDNPMWGKKKLAWLIRREGIAVSTSTVGRILRSLMDRGVVMPVPTLRRKPGGRRFRLVGKRYARRLPRGLKPTMPGQIVQIDTVFVTIAPGKAVKALHRLRPRRQMDSGSHRRTRHRRSRRPLPRQGAQPNALQGHRRPGRRWLRVHGRLRTGMQAKQTRPLRAAAKAAAAHCRRTLQRRMAI